MEYKIAKIFFLSRKYLSIFLYNNNNNSIINDKLLKLIGSWFRNFRFTSMQVLKLINNSWKKMHKR